MTNFPFVFPYRVHVVDINYGGHVANSAVLNFFQDARIAFLGSLGPYSELDIGDGCGIILPEAHTYYRAEMFLHDQLQIGVRVTEVQRSAFLLDYRIERNGMVTADGSTRLLAFDYQKRKVVRLPDVFRGALEAAKQG